MPIIGSDGGFAANNVANISDKDGRVVISSSTQFGAQPFGIAARNLLAYGIPNGSFELTPPDTTAVITEFENPLPFWEVFNNTDNLGYASAVYDIATNTWGVRMSLGSALSGSYLTLTTRAIVASDDYLQTRQRAYAQIEKVGTYSSTTQQNLQLIATYYDATGAALSTATLGTALDNVTTRYQGSNFPGRITTTVSGGTVVSGPIGGPTTASYNTLPANTAFVDFQLKLTATANVTSGVSFDVKSLIVDTTALTGGQVIVTQEFTSSGTFTVPTGVSNVNILAIGGGGGGAGGALATKDRAALGACSAWAVGGGGGGAGLAMYITGVPVTSGSAYSVGIGAGGAGGTAHVRTLTNTTNTVLVGTTGSNGAATTFGSLISVAGGTGGVGGTAGTANTVSVAGGAGGAGAALSYQALAANAFTPQSGGAGGSVYTTGGGASLAGAGAAGAGMGNYSITILPFYSSQTAGTAGGTASGTGGSPSSTGSAGAAGSAGVAGSGGGAGGAQVEQLTASTRQSSSGASGAGGFGGAGGGGVSFARASGSSSNGNTTSGVGGNASPNSGAGGGAGGSLAESQPVAGTATASAGGNGGSGLLVVSWVA